MPESVRRTECQRGVSNYIGCGYLVRCVTFPSFAVSRKKTIVSDRAARVGGVVAHKAFAVIAV